MGQPSEAYNITNSDCHQICFLKPIKNVVGCLKFTDFYENEDFNLRCNRIVTSSIHYPLSGTNNI